MTNRNSCKSLVLDAFSKLPEIKTLAFFGREAEGTSDEYSDFDIILVSTDLDKTQKTYKQVLSEISPIVSSFLILSKERHLVEMIALQDFNPYHKIDLSIVDNLEYENSFKPFTIVFNNSFEAHNSVTLLDNKIIVNDVNHKLTDILFSVPRFTKCLFRKDYDMYRTWQGIVKNIFMLLYEKYSGWQPPFVEVDLSPPQYKHLYSILNDEDKQLLLNALPLSGIFNIALSFKSLIKFYVKLASQKASFLNQKLNTVFIEYILTFLEEEITKVENEL